MKVTVERGNNDVEKVRGSLRASSLGDGRNWKLPFSSESGLEWRHPGLPDGAKLQDFFFAFFFLVFFVFFAFFGTFLPFLRASDRPIAIACLRLFTVPPLPPLPLLSLPFFFRFTARFTSVPALLL
jgi:hypothetical protein